MQYTNVESLERTIQRTNEWLKAIQEELQGDREHAYHALRATLHALRDRLGAAEAAHLGAQLPTLVRGVYYEGWKPREKPAPVRGARRFLDIVAAESGDPTLDAERAARAVFRLLSERVSRGEIEDVKGVLPGEIREFWPG